MEARHPSNLHKINLLKKMKTKEIVRVTQISGQEFFYNLVCKSDMSVQQKSKKENSNILFRLGAT